ncbi:MAG: WG repeat-containing protein [Muribaculaceae bacterium]
MTALTACSGDSERDLPCSYIAVQEEYGGCWSFYSPDGELKYPNAFKNMPSDVVDGYFFVQEGNDSRYTLYRSEDKPVPVAEDLSQAGFMGDGLIPVVRAKERITMLDGEGREKFILEPVDGNEVIRCSSRYHEGLLAIAVGDGKGGVRWGYADTEGKTVIAPGYSEASDFHDGVALARLPKEGADFGAEYVIIDKKGKEIKKFDLGTKPQGKRFFAGRLVVCDKDGRFSIADKKGETVAKLPETVKMVSDWNDDYVIYSDEEPEPSVSEYSYGVMNYRGETVIGPKYSQLQIIGPDSFLGTEKTQDGQTRVVILDEDGKARMQTGNYPYGAVWLAQFGILGSGSTGLKFVKDNGKSRLKAAFARVGGLAPEFINSEYFNAKDAIECFVGLITDRGLGRYVLGGTSDRFFTDPYADKEYTYSNVTGLDDMDRRGNNFRISALANFSDVIVLSSKADGGDNVCAWNPNSRLYRISGSIFADRWDAKDSKALADAIARKGFTIEATTRPDTKSYSALLTKDNMAVIITNCSFKTGVDITICFNTKQAREMAAEVIRIYDSQADRDDVSTSPYIIYDPTASLADTSAGE